MQENLNGIEEFCAGLPDSTAIGFTDPETDTCIRKKDRKIDKN